MKWVYAVDGINRFSPMTKYLVEKETFKKEPLSIIDVGASGGVGDFWQIFGKDFRGFGIEPLVAECNRLNTDHKKHTQVSYFPYIIISKDPEVQQHAGITGMANSAYQRGSGVKATELLKLDYITEYFNAGKQPEYSDQKISLDELVIKHKIADLDFIKIDTDGHDYEVLHGASHILNNMGVMGLLVECQMHGNQAMHSNVFRNIDRLLTEAGFTLFDLRLQRYAKADLPSRFFHAIPAQTVTGQVVWGDALYLRDCVEDNTRASKDSLTPLKILKLACLYELFSLPDCAAELLIRFQSELAPLVNISVCLDILTKNMGSNKGYDNYIEKFNQRPRSFYPTKLHRLKLAIKTNTARDFFCKLIRNVVELAFNHPILRR